MTARLVFKINNQYILFELPENLTENDFKNILENNNTSYGFQVEISEYYINITANSMILPIAVENGAQDHEFFANMYFYPKNSTQKFSLIRFAKSRYNAIKYSGDIEEIIYTNTTGTSCQKKYIILNNYNNNYFTGSDILSDFISKTQLLISYFVFQNTCSYNPSGSNDCINNAIGIRFRVNNYIITTTTLGQYFLNTNTLINQMLTEKLCGNNFYPKCIADNVPITFNDCSFLDELTVTEKNSQYIFSINDAIRFHFPNHPAISNSTKFIKISPGDYTFMKVRIYNAFNVHSKIIYKNNSSEMKSVPISIQEFCCVTNGSSLGNILFNKINDNFCNNNTSTISLYSSQGVRSNSVGTLYFSANEHIRTYGIISIGVSHNNVRFTTINNQCDSSHCSCFSTDSNQLCSCVNDACNIVNTESFANKKSKVNYSAMLIIVLIISFLAKK